MADSARWVRETTARSYMGAVSHGFFWKLVKDGLIQQTKIGRAVFYDLKEIDRFMEQVGAEQARDMESRSPKHPRQGFHYYPCTQNPQYPQNPLR